MSKAALPWDSQEIRAQVRVVLDSFEDVPPIDDAVRLRLQRWIYLRDKYGAGDGRGHLTAILRVFLESEVNRDALREPILSAVASVHDRFAVQHGLALLDAFDQLKLMELLATMRGLDLFTEASISSHLPIVLLNKIQRILEPAIARPAPTMEEKRSARERKRNRNERNIELGRQMLKLRSEITSNCEFSRLRNATFSVDTKHAASLMAVAKVLDEKPEIYNRLSWRALVELSSPTLPAAARAALERRILSDERIGAPEIRAARGALRTGRPRRQAERMAA